MSVVFFGSSKFVIPIIEVLRKNFDLKLVLTTEKLPSKVPQGEALRSYPVVNYCIENKIPYLSVSSLSDPNLKFKIENLKLKIAVLADFGLIIPQQILNIFPMGIINIHPSLLPKYRGPTPVQTAILNGEKVTGVSIMKLDNEIDHGPILGQEKEEILDADTSESLYKRLFEKGANLLLEVLPKYLNENLEPIPQNHQEATFTNHLTRQSGFLDFEKFKIKNSIKIKNLKLKIRAYAPWPGVWANLMINGKVLRIKFLPEEKIQVEGKKPMSYKDFINGYPDAAKNLEFIIQNSKLNSESRIINSTFNSEL